MALYIRDDDVNVLAEQVMATLGTKNKTEAVRTALELQLKQVKDEQTLIERVAPLREAVKKIGKPDPHFDMKTFSDDMWQG